MLRRLALAALGLVLAGCATPDFSTRVPEASWGGVDRVGVVSAMPDTFHGLSIGFTVFQNQYFTVPVPDWQIRNLMIRTTVDLVRKEGRNPSIAPMVGSLTYAQLRGSLDPLFKMAEDQGFDRVIALIPLQHEAPIRAFLPPGFGLVQRGNALCLFAAYSVAVYDVKSRDRIGWSTGGVEPSCERYADNDLAFRPAFAEYSEAERQELRRRTERLIEAGVAAALGRLAIVPRR